jgi:hypothetical protein
MSSSRLKLSLLVVFTLLYNYFFWEEKEGINLLLFSLLLLMAAIYQNPLMLLKKNVWVALAFTVTTALMVVLHNSCVSQLAHIISFFITVGFLHEARFRSVLYAGKYALQTALLTVGRGIPMLGRGLASLTPQLKVFGFAPRWLKLMMVPGAFFSVFFLIFSIANPIFAQLTGHLAGYIADGLEWLVTGISFTRLFFILPGLYLVAVVLYSWDNQKVYEEELEHSDTVTRRKVRRRGIRLGTIALRNERQAALVLIFSVNILLLVINVIDVRWLWLNFDPKTAGNLATLVHEGTYMLILSILLSMGILIYYFRKNLNFYPENRLLKNAAYLWLVQNVILSVSVLIRCYHYINGYGLAYKRIGVIIFLGLVFFGLYTLYRKISRQQSFFYLLRTNTWAAWTVLAGLSLVNWDVLIVEYNLKHPNISSGEIDAHFLLTRSDKTLPVLDANRSKLKADGGYSRHGGNSDEHLNRRIIDFMREYESYSWLSWNYADHKTYKYLRESRKLAAGNRQ